MRFLKIGDEVVAKAINVREKYAIFQIIDVESKEKVVLNNSFSFIFPPNVAKTFVYSIKDYFRIGDIVKAKVHKITPFFVNLTTIGPKYGVIKAFCSKCRYPLKKDGNKLVCPRCGSVEKRKISEEFDLYSEKTSPEEVVSWRLE